MIGRMTRRTARAAPSAARPRTAPPGEPRRSLAAWIDELLAGVGRQQSPIVPRATVVGRSLVFVTAVMAFLACLALGTAWAASRAAQSWTVDAAREVTVQLKPAEGIDPDSQTEAALRIVRATRGVLAARALSKEENARMLEPWLGAGLDLDELPVPRLVALTLDPVVPADTAALASQLAQEVPGAALDDHRTWQAQVRSLAGWVVFAAFAVLVLMLGATMAIIVFATRGAMAGNRSIVEVLHLVGARQDFIAREFQRHFLVLGLKGGLIGGAAAAGAFLVARLVVARLAAPGGEAADGALIHSLSIGLSGYAGIAGIVAGIAVLGAVTSRITVYRHLRGVE